MTGGTDGFGDPVQRVAQGSQVQVAADAAGLLACLDNPDVLRARAQVSRILTVFSSPLSAPPGGRRADPRLRPGGAAGRAVRRPRTGGYAAPAANQPAAASGVSRYVMLVVRSTHSHSGRWP